MPFSIRILEPDVSPNCIRWRHGIVPWQRQRSVLPESAARRFVLTVRKRSEADEEARSKQAATAGLQQQQTCCRCSRETPVSVATVMCLLVAQLPTEFRFRQCLVYNETSHFRSLRAHQAPL